MKISKTFEKQNPSLYQHLRSSKLKASPKYIKYVACVPKTWQHQFQTCFPPKRNIAIHIKIPSLKNGSISNKSFQNIAGGDLLKNDRLWLDFLDKNSLEILESRKKEQRPYEIYESSKSYSQMTFGCLITSIWCIVFSFHVQPFSV